MKKIGIITFHNSYNCGSMLESFAIQKYLTNQKIENEIIDFSNFGQRNMYSVLEKNTNIKKVIKNAITLLHYKKVKRNNQKYEEFKKKNFMLSDRDFVDSKDLSDDEYSIVVAGSDQIWNITIPDADDAYFLPWVKKARKVAYAPSFGAKNIKVCSNDVDKYKRYLKSFDGLSTREYNGKKWIKDLIGEDVEVIIDPTLLLEKDEYDNILDDKIKVPEKYIFFYCPSFNTQICKFVKELSNNLNIPVITWSTKKYYLKGINRFGFDLPEYESPSAYLKLIKNAELVLTTSFHGTIFSTIYKKKFFTLKNGDMYGDDDRVYTLLDQLGIMNRLIECKYDEKFDYLQNVDYTEYDKNLPILKVKAKKYIKNNIEEYYNETGK